MSGLSLLGVLLLAAPAAGPTQSRPVAPAAAAAQANLAARSYCDAWRNGDFNQMKELFLTSRHVALQEEGFVSMSRRNGVRCSTTPSTARPESTPDGASTVFSSAVRMSSGAASTTLYLTPEGQIAFDPILVPHPGVILGRAILRLYSSSLVDRSAAEAVLINRGMPLMGYSAQADEVRRKAAADKLESWWKASQGEVGTGFPLSPEDVDFIGK